jgi:hypothetical protein
MTDELTIFCAYCGAENPVNTETCVSCKAELVPPHPILMEGGEIYTLHCTQCGQRLPVAETQGYVSCAICGLSHAIVTGQGYLTVVPAPGANGMSIRDFMGMEAAQAPNTMPPLPQRPQGSPYQPNQAIPLQWQVDSLQKTLDRKTTELKKRQNRRTKGTVMLFMGLIVDILVIIDGTTIGSLGDVIGPIFLFGFFLIFLIGLIILLATGKRKDRMIEAEIAAIQRDLNHSYNPQGGYSTPGVNR